MSPLLFDRFYKNFAKPLLFLFDPEFVHESFALFAEYGGRNKTIKQITQSLFNYQNANLNTQFAGISFKNPVGLAAGYDYNGHFVELLPYVGFGFSTVGTVTNHPYQGNDKPRYVRLVKSGSIMVNKGFKSDGADVISKRLIAKNLDDVNYGISIGSSNIPSINTINTAIDDYLACFSKMAKVISAKYYELNISCPNIHMADSFTNEENFTLLLKEISKLGVGKPVFIKMPSELEIEQTKRLVEAALRFNLNSFIFSNLIKNRARAEFNKEEMDKVAIYKGNFSGNPAKALSNLNVKQIRDLYGAQVNIIGCGGIFSPKDAKERLNNGADMIQLITGMIFEGPQLIGNINRFLSKE